MKGFDAGKAIAFIKQVKGDATDESDDVYAEPNFSVETKEGFLTVPKVDQLTLTDASRKNVSKILEVFYSLSSVCGQIETYLKAVRPDEVGEKIDRAKIPAMSVEEPKFDQHYIDFVNQWNMQRYCNIQKVDMFLESSGVFLAEDTTKRRAQKEKTLEDLLFQKFIELQRSRK